MLTRLYLWPFLHSLLVLLLFLMNDTAYWLLELANPGVSRQGLSCELVHQVQEGCTIAWSPICLL